MATFPDLEPAARSYDLGTFPLTEQASLSAGTVRFSHGATATNFSLQLEYVYLSDAEAALIRTHYQGQGGNYRSFLLPSIIWKGHTFSGNVFPVGTRWRYADTPEETHLSGGLVNLTVSLVSDGTYEGAAIDPITVGIAPGAGVGTAAPALIGSFINSGSTADTSHELTVPTHADGDLLIAVLMWRNNKGTLTVPAGWSLQGTYTSSIVFSGNIQNLLVYTKTASTSEPASYTWSATASTRNCGLMASVRNGVIDSVTESYGNGTTATISAVSSRLNLTVFTWIYAAASGTETYSQSGTGLTQISDSPKEQARISGGYTTTAGTITSTHSATNESDAPNHGGINIQLRIP
jgi:hypothetical protein